MSSRLIQGQEAHQLTWAQKWDLLSPYLLQYGSGCMAYATLQPDMEYLVLEGKGFLAFRRQGRLWPVTLVLGDPISSKADAPALIDAMLKAHPRATFLLVTRTTAFGLARRGYFANECGIETSIDVPGWDIAGVQKRNHRAALAKVEAMGIVIKECAPGEDDDLECVSSAWRKGKVVNDVELAFLTTPASYESRPHVVRYIARLNGKILGFVIYNPLFIGGRVTGLVGETFRSVPDAPHGLIYAMHATALARFKQQGLKRLSLGWSPLYGIEDRETVNSAFTTLLFTAVFQLANGMYSFKGLAENKRNFCGEKIPMYFATPHRFPLRQVYATFQACNIRPARQLLRSAFASPQAESTDNPIAS